MNILIVGGGGREHAITLSLKKSPLLKKLVVAPGNPGIAEIAECQPVEADNIKGICNLAKNINADIVFIGPELPLVLGLKDRLSNMGIRAFGPSGQAAKLEGSKVFAREFCQRHNIPQPNFKSVNNLEEAKNEVHSLKGHCVIKADGLAAGKGVVVCENIEEAITASRQILEEKKFGKSGETILIEERIKGVEVSFFVVSDGNNVVLLGTAQDHKRALDNDEGPNTGGMGAISPSPHITKKLTNEIMKKIILPTIKGMRKENNIYEGILYAGIMLTNKGPKLIEFNCRFGDPEAQVILPLLKTDLIEILKKTINKQLNKFKVQLLEKKAITVVIASKGYPEKITNGLNLPPIDFLTKSKDINIYHSGTEINEKNELISKGGRIFSFTTCGDNFNDCRDKIYNAICKIQWKNEFFRKDIGKLKNLS